MGAVHEKVVIDARRDKVWNLVNDLSRRPEWMPGVKRVVALTPGEPDFGYNVRTEGVYIIPWSMEMVYLNYDEGRLVAARTAKVTGVPLRHLTGSWRVEPLPEFRTLFSISLAWEANAIIDRLLLTPLLTSLTRKALNRAKMLAET